MSDDTSINRSKSRSSRAYGKGQRLWQEELDRVYKMIQEHLESLDIDRVDKSDDYDSEPILSIAIFSPAGAGKSSLLKTLVREVKDGPDKLSVEDKTRERIKHVSTLDILQPARFGVNGELVYAMVAAGLDAHNQKRGEEPDYEVLTPVLKEYRKLSNHLRTIRGDKISDELEDAELNSQVIQRLTSSMRITKVIESFVNALADDLNGTGSVLLLPVDDLDMAPDQLVKGLQQLQAYLRHPRLIPIFTFTDRLAEDILADYYKTALKYADRKRQSNGRMDASEQLASQYLSKCFPVRNRIRFGSIPANLQSKDLSQNSYGGLDLSLSDSESQHTEPVWFSLLTASLLMFGIKDRSSGHPIRAALRSSTVRRQLHVIDSIYQSEINELISQQKIKHYFSGSDVCGRYRTALSNRSKPSPFTATKSWVKYFDRAVWGLLNVHRDVLLEYDMQMEDLYSWTPRALRTVILNTFLNLEDKAQMRLWRMWRNNDDSRRNQVISLLAVNSHRPWLSGEAPSGEDYYQLHEFKANNDDCADGLEKSKLSQCSDKISAPLSFLWFLNLTLGFYLPANQAVFRVLREVKSNQEHLDGSEWTLENAPIQAAQTADENHEFYSTGMLFLDPISYSISLTNPARMAACAALDEMVTKDISIRKLLSQAKTAFLGLRTSDVISEFCKLLQQTKESTATKGQQATSILLLFGNAADNICLQDSFVDKVLKIIIDKDLVGEFGCLRRVLYQALCRYVQVYLWKIKPNDYSVYCHGELKDTMAFNHASAFYQQFYQPVEKARGSTIELTIEIDDWIQRLNRTPTEKRLQIFDYASAKRLLSEDKAYNGVDDPELNCPDPSKIAQGIKNIEQLEHTAQVVYDDQLMLRIWTCYGYNRGRFWAVVSLWRGLGLIGEIIEKCRKLLSCYSDSEQSDDKQNKKKLKLKIFGIIRTHIIKGLVPGKGLSELTRPHDLEELAFPQWDTAAQRAATDRLASRLVKWLITINRLKVYPFYKAEPSWNECFIRRLHGGYVLGSLWQWLDVEHFEYQPTQRGHAKRNHWNAGVAISCWLSVMQRYFRGSFEISWLLNSCPLTSAFLPNNLCRHLVKLYGRSYSQILSYVSTVEEQKNAKLLHQVVGGLQRLCHEDEQCIKLIYSQLGKDNQSATRLSALLYKAIKELQQQSVNIPQIDQLLKNIKKVNKTCKAIWNRLNKVDAQLNLPEQDGSHKRVPVFADSDRAAFIDFYNCFQEYRKQHLNKDKKLDPHYEKMVVTECCYRVLQLWTTTIHISSTSLFYQVPRVSRSDFFYEEQYKNNCDCE